MSALEEQKSDPQTQAFTAIGRVVSQYPKTHPLYRAFFEFKDGPPATSHELNGWGDDMIHDYLKAIEIDNRLVHSCMMTQ